MGTNIIKKFKKTKNNINYAKNHSGTTVAVVPGGAVNIYEATVEALRKKERQDETQFITKFVGKISLGPNYFTLSNFDSQLQV